LATFADQINDGPVSLAHLDVVELQANRRPQPNSMANIA
jgi:hypothetical protein